ncbi:unnamed protein product [Citrullus colocynthis]|uniref:Secreted protein n=1 Tax=Citrullus colocynthis TaxID=252529 RepID=A0ABP0YIP8_9ROSI
MENFAEAPFHFIAYILNLLAVLQLISSDSSQLLSAPGNAETCVCKSRLSSLRLMMRLGCQMLTASCNARELVFKHSNSEDG